MTAARPYTPNDKIQDWGQLLNEGLHARGFYASDNPAVNTNEYLKKVKAGEFSRALDKLLTTTHPETLEKFLSPLTQTLKIMIDSFKKRRAW